MWAESYGFTDKCITEEIEGQPETNVNFHQLDGRDQDALSEPMHMASIRKSGKEATSLSDKKYVDKQGNLTSEKSFKTIVGESDMTGKMDVYDLLGKMCYEIPNSVLDEERESSTFAWCIEGIFFEMEAVFQK